MSLSLQDLLKKEIKRMIVGIGRNGKGNIFPLITEEVEKIIISLVLQETNYNFLQTAKLLGISRSTLYRKVQLYNIPNEAPVELFASQPQTGNSLTDDLIVLNDKNNDEEGF